MILVRMIFQARFGKGGEVAAAMIESTGLCLIERRESSAY